MLLKVFCFILLLILSSISNSQTAVDSVDLKFIPNIRPELNINKVPNNSIKIDGIVNEGEWNGASIADNFTEVSPGENVRPEVNTKAFIAYDDENVYMGFICWDDMNTLRVSMTDRDRMFNDDWVGAFIDTYNDMKQGTEFYTNAYGVQGDLIWSTNYEDSSPDFIYETEAKIYNDKWTAEIKIPFKSLKFPDIKDQVWRVHLIRNRPRGYRQEIYWASLNKDDPNFMGQAGLWKGIKNIKSGKNLELLPYIIGNFNATNDLNLPDPKLKYNKFNGDAGIGLKYGLSSNITLDLAINPDFSQVEADAPQIDINSVSALFFNEKRPFFLSSTSIFISNLNILYTRSLVNPLIAVKVTGKINKLDVGLLSAFDENTPFLIPYSNGSFFKISNKNSLSNILRLKYDMGGENFLGFFYSDREESNDSNKVFKFDGYNRVISFDGRFGLLNNYYLGFQLFYYLTKEIKDTAFFSNKTKFGKEDKYDLALNGEKFNGPGAYLNIEHSARNWSFFTEYNYQSPYARRDNGYAARNDFHELFMQHNYNIYPQMKMIYKIIPGITGSIRYSSDGKIKDQWLQPQINIKFRNGLILYGNYIVINNEEYGGIMHKNINRWYTEVSYDYNNKISGMISYGRGKYIVRFTDPSYIGTGQNIYLGFTFNPLDRIRINIDYSYSDLFNPNTHENLYRGYVLSATSYFVFNKKFFLRLITQYDDFDKVFDIEPLISYKWNPFTIFYIGSTHLFQKDKGFKERDRKIFAKFQYLWSL